MPNLFKIFGVQLTQEFVDFLKKEKRNGIINDRQLNLKKRSEK
jgi:hypothetical protein